MNESIGPYLKAPDNVKMPLLSERVRDKVAFLFGYCGMTALPENDVLANEIAILEQERDEAVRRLDQGIRRVVSEEKADLQAEVERLRAALESAYDQIRKRQADEALRTMLRALTDEGENDG